MLTYDEYRKIHVKTGFNVKYFHFRKVDFVYLFIRESDLKNIYIQDKDKWTGFFLPQKDFSCLCRYIDKNPKVNIKYPKNMIILYFFSDNDLMEVFHKLEDDLVLQFDRDYNCNEKCIIIERLMDTLFY